MMIPAGLPMKSSPIADPNFPTAVLRDINPIKAIPAAVCGITIGRLMIPVTRFFNGNSRRASRYENGTAAMANTSVAATEAQTEKEDYTEHTPRTINPSPSRQKP